jgi:hypothetical protein
MNLKNHKKDRKKNNLLSIDSRNQVESSSNFDENIVCTSMQKEVNINILHSQEDKEMTKIFCIKIKVKKTEIDAMFDSGSHDLVRNIGLEVHDHPSPYPLGW